MKILLVEDEKECRTIGEGLRSSDIMISYSFLKKVTFGVIDYEEYDLLVLSNLPDISGLKY